MPLGHKPHSPTLIEGLPAAIADIIWAAATTERYTTGQIIHYRGDKKPGLSIVKSGSVDVGTLGRDGRILSIGTLGVGESFGEFTLFADLPRTHDISALEPSIIAQIPASKMHALCDAEPLILKALLRVALIRSHAAFERLDDDKRLSLAVRTAKRLLGLTGRESQTKTLSMTQSDIAHMMGVSRVSIGKALEALTRGGFITRGYGVITINDPTAMQDWVARHSVTHNL
ncbi:Crp/Fnr family transcriptional regulator [Fretibacter rubidus]|uniref:Crp/Fnr family transcriptional regulator n=1 Tax=Fretibacter rubidus TaxID=570162 RepID=UPI00352A157E